MLEVSQAECHESLAIAFMEFSRRRSSSDHPLLSNGAGRRLARTQTLGGVQINRLRAGDTGVGLFDASEKQFPGVPHHTFEIEGPNDPKELIEELAAKGITVDETRMHGNGPGYSVYLTDPSGNRLELSKE